MLKHLKQCICLCLSMTMALSLWACGDQTTSPETPPVSTAVAETVDVVSADAPGSETVGTEPVETVPEETKPEFYMAHDFSYHSQLGEPVLGEAAAQLAAAKDHAAAAEQINNVGDAIFYMEALPEFNQPIQACHVFTQLLGDDYDEVGLIRLWRQDNGYILAYIQQDGVFYPFSPFDIPFGELLWSAAPTSGTDRDAICEELMTTFPFNPKKAPMQFYMLQPLYTSECHVVDRVPYALALGAPVLGEAAAELAAAGNLAAAAEQITNVGDAILYMNAAPKAETRRSEDACKLFTELLANDYDQVGLITLTRPDLVWDLAYIQHDGIFYPFEPDWFVEGSPIWGTLVEGRADLDALCEEMVTTFPFHEKAKPMKSYRVDLLYAAGVTNIKGINYASVLGEPVLGEDIKKLAKAKDHAAAAEQITNVGDAIHYMKAISKIRRKEEAAKVFAKLIGDDYDEVGTIKLSGPEAMWILVYVQQDGVYYSFDPFNFPESRPVWCSPLELETDFDALCEKLMNTCPYHRDGKPMTSYKTEVLYSSAVAG